MGVIKIENRLDESFCPPKEDPLDIDKEWSRRAKEELNEDPEQARKNLRLLEEKIKADKSLNSRLDDVFLMAFLRGKKHDVDGAYKLIKTYYEMKHNYPNFYQPALPSERQDLYDMGYLALVPGRDKNGCNIGFCIPSKMDFNLISIEEVFQVGASIFETALMNPEMQISGICIILDMRELTLMQQARLINPRFAHQLTNCIQEKIPVRIKAIHVVNQPSYFNALYAIFRPFLKKKIRQRMRLHGTDWNSLHQFVSPEYLPIEMGGKVEYNTKYITDLIRNNEKNLIEFLITVVKYIIHCCMDWEHFYSQPLFRHPGPCSMKLQVYKLQAQDCRPKINYWKQYGMVKPRK